ncbi:MAG: biotin transporter BioY [Planctomycetota bacterium]|jgi:biotin transporter BioY
MLANATVAGLFRPSNRAYAALYDIILIIAGSFLIGFSAQLKVLLPFSPVPVTGQTFAVLMIGALFGARRGCLAVLAYIIQGIMGLPVFALGAGPAVLAGPTGGYLLGFIPAAYITGSLAQSGWDRRIGTTILAMLLGNAAIYACGLGWLVFLMGFTKAVLVAGLYPFILGDILKTLLAAAVLPAGWKFLTLLNLPLKNR